MDSIQRYLNEARSKAHQNYNSADGFMDDLSFTGDDFFQAQGNTANVGGGSAPTSQPYIITITSTSGSAVSNFEVLGSYEYVQSANFQANGDYVDGSITVSSGISGVTYRQMLNQFATTPFSVGLTYIQSATANQVLETISVNTRDANGNEAQKTFVPTIDPYQQQSTVVAMRYGYKIDGYTKLIIRQILANATVKLYLYPSDNINLARGLSNSNVARGFANPQIVKAQTIKLQ